MKLVELPSPKWAKLQNCILNFIYHMTKNLLQSCEKVPQSSFWICYYMYTLNSVHNKYDSAGHKHNSACNKHESAGYKCKSVCNKYESAGHKHITLHVIWLELYKSC